MDENTKATGQGIYSDSPKDFICQDEFGRKEFVNKLAKMLAQDPSIDEGLVMSISGPWGSGKTSVRNMVIQKLDLDYNEERNLHVVEFEPWMYAGSGNGKLVSLLFDRIAGKLQPKKQKSKDFLRKHRKAISAGLAAGEKVKYLGAISAGFKEIADAVDDDIDSLHERRQHLKSLLEDFSGRIIVFIDDLDRLSDTEMAAIVQAVKAVGGLPRVAYVLLYDRDVVTRALDRDYHDGAGFLQKIVQVPIQLPAVPQERIVSFIREEFTNITGVGTTWDNLAIWDACVSPFIHTHRDAVTLLNRFRNHYLLIGDDVEAIELLGLTAIEAFDNPLYQWIEKHKSLLTNYFSNPIEPYGAKIIEQEENDRALIEQRFAQNSVKSLKDTAFPTHAEEKRALKTLFPAMGDFLDSTGPLSHSRRDHDGRNHIESPTYFDSYFNLQMAKGQIHESAYRELLLHDPLDGTPTDAQRDVLRSPAFPDKTARYLRDDDSGRLTGLVGMCIIHDSTENPLQDSNVAASLIGPMTRRQSYENKESQDRKTLRLTSMADTAMQSPYTGALPLLYALCLDCKYLIEYPKPDEHGKDLQRIPGLLGLLGCRPIESFIDTETGADRMEETASLLERMLGHLAGTADRHIEGKRLRGMRLRFVIAAAKLLFPDTKDLKPALEDIWRSANPDEFRILTIACFTETDQLGKTANYSIDDLPMLRDLVPYDQFKETLSKLSKDKEFRDHMVDVVPNALPIMYYLALYGYLEDHPDAQPMPKKQLEAITERVLGYA